MKPKGAKTALWYVYVLRCRGGTLYTGIARDPWRRLKEHRAGRGSRHVLSRLPAHLVYLEKAHGLSQALKREAEIKRWTRPKKLALIRKPRPRRTS